LQPEQRMLDPSHDEVEPKHFGFRRASFYDKARSVAVRLASDTRDLVAGIEVIGTCMYQDRCEWLRYSNGL
jgi:hypothetical protein